MLVLVAFGIIKQHPGGQAKDGDQLHQRESTAGLLGAGLGIGALVFGRVGQSGGSAVEDLEGQALPKLLGLGQVLLDPRRHGMANALEHFQRQAQAGLAEATGAPIDLAAIVQSEQSLNLVDDLAAGASGIERLKEKAPKGAAQRVNALAAVG